ncbi:MAG: hormogonium polysaccharide biosynthesis glycosyltransferase HpsE [Leptolyngbya sp.]|nr:hormogonium polysaccharide biosynthesis glycosyltransferase HpsE [Leptolyngbya sp.]
MDIVVVIPTYNGSQRLPEVLDALHQQTSPTDCEWAVWVVDNNSTDDTATVVREYQARWGDSRPLEYHREPRQGAGFVRHYAVEHAPATWIAFLDDDNIPDQGWLIAAWQFIQRNPTVGALSSRIRGDFEAEHLPPDFEQIAPYLAITERGDNPRRYDAKLRLVPPSAGLVVRKQAWQQCVPDHCILNGRKPGSMLTGEDTEVLCHILVAGWPIWYVPTMTLQHKIPAGRLERSYLIPFFRGIGLSRYVTRTVGVSPLLKPFLALAYSANDALKVVCHVLKWGRRVRQNLIAACMLELFISSLRSPLYLWQHGYLRASISSQHHDLDRS